ncbi:MAG: leucyl/phenylalanyl-tRNA--protein transferase [Zetaproteobacteria bacterium]|nr:MAG: leucyl/phenylalanyl-tRNA--protein transferase [Zetaproteobacteria bacterium]
MQITLTPDILLAAYSQGLFPMAQSADNPEIHWFCPEVRGQLSIPDMHIPRRLKKNVRQMKIGGQPYEIRLNTDFKGVMLACANMSDNREETWINAEILTAYCALHVRGYAHSVECWQDNKMVGGLYGIALGGAFFGESMFCLARDASKVALVHLVARLDWAGYKILDTQFINDHLEQFGVHEVPHQVYMKTLEAALHIACKFDSQERLEKDLITQYLS